MATLILTYDTGTVPLSRIITAVCLIGGYSATIPDPANPGATIANPETQAQFARRYVGQFVINTVLQADNRTATAGITAVSLA